jgi:hypothetical protein
VRLAAVAVSAAVPAIGHKLSSTDEAAFIATTHRLAALPLSDGKWLSMAVHWTEVIPWALTLKVFGDCGTLPLRLEQIGLSLTAVIIVSATASRVGGRRAGLIAAWVAAIEPSSVYFAGLIHQEPLCMVGEALLLAALVDLWIRRPTGGRLTWQTAVTGLVGLALIYGTRSYMAFFAGVAVILVLFGAGLCNRLGLSRGLLALTTGSRRRSQLGRTSEDGRVARPRSDPQTVPLAGWQRRPEGGRGRDVALVCPAAGDCGIGAAHWL